MWDTVGALGAPYGEILGYVVDKLFKCSFHDVELSKSVDSAYHALAADERRWPFRPTPIELTDYHKERNDANLAEFGFPLYAQKWFPGVHSNVGGGYDRWRPSPARARAFVRAMTYGPHDRAWTGLPSVEAVKKIERLL